jgi:hypothetical protein
VISQEFLFFFSNFKLKLCLLKLNLRNKMYFGGSSKKLRHFQLLKKGIQISKGTSGSLVG